MEIRIACLPVTILRTESVKSDDESYDYELMLTEFINSSEAFMKLTGDREVHHRSRKDQSSSEWDCYCGVDPFLDFKLLCSQKMQQALGDASIQFVDENNEFSIIHPTLNKRNYYGYWLHELMEGKKLDDYLVFESKKENELDEKEAEIRRILKIMRTPKRCLFLFSDYFWSTAETPYSVFNECAIWYFNRWAIELLKYRDRATGAMDTYVAIFIPQYRRLLVLKWKSDQEKLDVFDSISISSSSCLKKHMELDSGNQFYICIKRSVET